MREDSALDNLLVVHVVEHDTGSTQVVQYRRLVEVCVVCLELRVFFWVLVEHLILVKPVINDVVAIIAKSVIFLAFHDQLTLKNFFFALRALRSASVVLYSLLFNLDHPDSCLWVLVRLVMCLGAASWKHLKWVVKELLQRLRLSTGEASSVAVVRIICIFDGEFLAHLLQEVLQLLRPRVETVN